MKPLIIVLALLLAAPAWSFNLTRHSVPVPALSTGGVPKDAIPALHNPEFRSAEQAGDLKPEEHVMGVVINGEARAHPIRLLIGHEADLLFSQQRICVRREQSGGTAAIRGDLPGDVAGLLSPLAVLFCPALRAPSLCRRSSRPTAASGDRVPPPGHPRGGP